MEYLKINNWDKWQTYRADRGQPPWIKIHRRIMRNPEWVSSTDEERGQLVAIWLLAADRDGVIPASSELIQKLCFMTKPPNLSKFMDLGFIKTSDAIMTPTRRQHDHPKAEAKAEAKAEVETEKKDKYLDYVFLTQEEHKRLTQEFGERILKEMISELDNYIGAMPKKRNKYTDHNRVLRGWVQEKILGNKSKAEAAPKLPYYPTMKIEKPDGTEKYRDVSKLTSGLKDIP